MLKIRLQRVGRKNDPSYRVVVTESTAGPKSGRAIEVVGSYDARRDRVQSNPERIKHWLSVGAKASATVHNLLVSQKVITGEKINVVPKPKAAAPAAEAPAENIPAGETEVAPAATTGDIPAEMTPAIEPETVATEAK